MANYKATGKKARKGPELAQRIRQAMLDALDLVEKDGASIPDILADALEENPIKFLELASKYIPRNIDLVADVTHTVEHNRPELEAALVARGIDPETLLDGGRTH